MEIVFLWIGKSKFKSYENLIDTYEQRLKHYCRHQLVQLKEVKHKSNPDTLKKNEADLFLSQLSDSDFVVLLDERGKQYSSIELSSFLQKRMNAATNRLVFIIGGAYGVDAKVIERANQIWSLSKLTLTHDMARILLLEQVYRGYTILRGEKYHNE